MIGLGCTVVSLLGFTAAVAAGAKADKPDIEARRDHIQVPYAHVTPVNGGIHRPETEVFHPLVTRFPEPGSGAARKAASRPQLWAVRRDEAAKKKDKKKKKDDAVPAAATKNLEPLPPVGERGGFSFHYSPMFVEMPPGFKVTPKQIVNYMIVGNRTLLNADRLITIHPGVGVTFTGHDYTTLGRMLPILHQMLLDKASNACGLAGFSSAKGKKKKNAPPTWQLMSFVGIRAIDSDGKVVAEIGYELVNPNAKDDTDDDADAKAVDGKNSKSDGDKKKKEKPSPTGWQMHSDNWHTTCMWAKFIPGAADVIKQDVSLWFEGIDKYRAWNEHYGQEHYAREIDKLLWEAERKGVPIQPDLRDRLLDGRGVPVLSEAEYDEPVQQSAEELEQEAFEQMFSSLTSLEPRPMEDDPTRTSFTPGGGHGSEPTSSPRPDHPDPIMLRQARCHWFDNSGSWEQMIPYVAEEEGGPSSPPPSVRFRRALDIVSRSPETAVADNGTLLLTRAMAHAQLLGSAISAISLDNAPPELTALKTMTTQLQRDLSLVDALDDSPSADNLVNLVYIPYFTWRHRVKNTNPSEYARYKEIRRNSKARSKEIRKKERAEKWDRQKGLIRAKLDRMAAAKEAGRTQRQDERAQKKADKGKQKAEAERARADNDDPENPPYRWKGPKPPVHMPEELVEEQDWHPRVGEPCCGEDTDDVTKDLKKLYDDLLAVDHPKDGKQHYKLFKSSLWRSTVDAKWAPIEAASDAHARVEEVNHVWLYAKFAVDKLETVRSMACDFFFSPGHQKARRQLVDPLGVVEYGPAPEEGDIDIEGWCAANLTPSEDLWTGELLPPAEVN